MFTDPEVAIAITKQYAGIPTTTVWDTAIMAVLEASKATQGYRIYLAAAMHLWSVSVGARGQIKSAEGVQWLTPHEIAEAIGGLLAMQEAFDQGLTGIPPGWAVADKRSLLCGCTPPEKSATIDKISVGFVV